MMRSNITTQLFAVMLGLCLLVIVAIGIANAWSVRQAFNDYTLQQDNQRAEVVAGTLAELYRQTGSWQILRDRPQLWQDILSMDEASRPTDEHSGGRPVVPRNLRSHWSLLDPRNRVVAGNAHPGQDAQRYGIVIGGQYVGQLVVSISQRVISPGEAHFLEEQRRSAVLLMVLSAGMALIAALLLARRFLAPIRELAQGMHTLATGNFEVHIHDRRQDEFGQLARDFNALSKTLQRNEQLRRSFVADISHELRTPLAILNGEIEAIADGIRPATVENVASLQHEVQALTRLVDDLYQLALSDVGGLRYQMQPLDWRRSIALTADAFEDRLAEQQLSLSVDLPQQPVLIAGDESRLTQLVTNLLENSARYTDPGGQVVLRLSTTDTEAILDLQDSAPGVPVEELPRLFERLYRVEASRNRATGGAGLGLPLCQSITQAHHGDLHAQPSPLGGIWLQIRLPLLSSAEKTQ